MQHCQFVTLGCLLLLSHVELLVEGVSPWLPLSPLSFLRGGSSSATAVASRTKQTRYKRQYRPHWSFATEELMHAHTMVQILGVKLQKEIQNQWNGLQTNIAREWSKLPTGRIRFLPTGSSKSRSKSSKLDEVCQQFSCILNSNNQVDTAKLLKACRVHLEFIQSSGSTLRLVAKDLEANIQKAETLFQKSPKECQYLTSMLILERDSGIHYGSILCDPSAAIGLLWIRRSLAFQADLYSSLVMRSSDTRQAAMNAYAKHLQPYHGWVLSKIFPASFSQMPERQVLMAKLGGVNIEEFTEKNDEEIVEKLKILVNSWNPLLNRWKNDFERLGLEDIRRV